MKKVFLTPEGWLVTDVRVFRWFFDHQPPRPNAYLHQLAVDARNWKPIAFWIVGGGLLAMAVTIREWLLIPLPLVLLAYWFRAFGKTVPVARESPLLVGVVGTLDRFPNPIMFDHLLGRAQIGDGREIEVAVPIRLMQEIGKEHETIQVLIVYMPTMAQSFVIGARGLPE